MFVIIRKCTGLFAIAIVYNFILVATQQESRASDEIMETGFGNKVTHRIVTRSGEMSPNGIPSQCFLLELQAEVVFRDPNDPADTKQENIIIDTSEKSHTFKGCPFDTDEEKPRKVSIFGLSTYGIRFNILKNPDENHWYVDSIFLGLSSVSLKQRETDQFQILRSHPYENFMETPLDKAYACRESQMLPLYEDGKIEAELIFYNIRLQIYNIPEDGTYSTEFLCVSYEIHDNVLVNFIIVAVTAFLIGAGIATVWHFVKKRRRANMT